MEKKLQEHRRDQTAALRNRLSQRRAAMEKALLRAGAGEEETAEAMKALAFEEER